jgi:tetratricopeptide (TPR) repeat protein
MSLDVATQGDFLARFQHKIARNATSWLAFLFAQRDDPQALDRELPNIVKAAQQALAESSAWQPGLALVEHAWPHVELRGYLLAWQGLLEQALLISQGLEAESGAALATDREAALLDQMGELARALGDNTAALNWQQAALARYRAAGSLAGAGRVLSHLSQVHLALSGHAAATDCCAEAAAICAIHDAKELAIVHNNWGLVCAQQGQLEDAIAHYRQAEAGFAAQGNRRGQAKARNNQGEVYRRLGRWDDAARCYEQAIALHRQVGDEINVARTQMNLGILYHSQGRTVEALALHQAIEPTFRRLGDRPNRARVANNEGVFLMTLGRLAEAQTAYDLAFDLYQAIGDPLLAADTLTNCAELLLDQGKSAEAQGYLLRAQDLLRSIASVPRWLAESMAAQQMRLAAAQEAQPAE